MARAKQEKQPTRIIRAEIHDFKRVEVVEINAAGEAVEITGKNAQGKSSVLDALEATLGGKRRQPPKPIRRGTEGARVVVELDEYTIERVWTRKSDRLVVRNSEGASFPAPQKKLDSLVGPLAFDPMAFMSLEPAEQRDRLLEVVGVDLAALEEEHDQAYAKRREIGREVRSLGARLDAAPKPAKGTPKTEVSVAEAVADLDEAMAKNRAHETKRGEVRRLAQREQEARHQHEQAELSVRQAEQRLEEARRVAKEAGSSCGELTAKLEEERKAADALADIDLEPIRERIASAERVNGEVRKAQARAAIERDLAKAQKRHGEQEDAIKAVATKKADALAGADMPVDGLEITDDGLALDGVPFEQVAMSQKVRACTAITAALNSELRIALVRSGNELDDEVLAAFYEACAKADLQPWVERISGITEGAIVIEAGKVKP